MTQARVFKTQGNFVSSFASISQLISAEIIN